MYMNGKQNEKMSFCRLHWAPDSHMYGIVGQKKDTVVTIRVYNQQLCSCFCVVRWTIERDTSTSSAGACSHRRDCGQIWRSNPPIVRQINTLARVLFTHMHDENIQMNIYILQTTMLSNLEFVLVLLCHLKEDTFLCKLWTCNLAHL